MGNFNFWNLLKEKNLIPKSIGWNSREDLAKIYEAYRAWKCMPMIPSPFDEVYLMHGGDVVFIGSMRRAEQFAREWRSEPDAPKERATAGFDQWYVENAFDLEQSPIGSRDYTLQKKAWYAGRKEFEWSESPAGMSEFQGVAL